MDILNGSLINIMNEIWGIILGIAGLIVIYIYRKNRVAYVVVYFRDVKCLCLCNMASMFFDLVGSLFNGKAGAFPYLIERVMNFGLYASNDFLIFLFCLFVIHCLENCVEEKIVKIYRYIAISVLIFNWVLLIVSQFTGILYYIDGANFYQRGALFALNQATGIAMQVIDLLLVIFYGSKMDVFLKRTIYCYTIIPVIAVVGGFLFKGVVFLFIATSVSILIFLVALFSYNAVLLKKQEQEIADQAMNAMISQIQPHFLYNSISAIMGIEGNPPETKKALSDFGKYLRGNLDVLKSNTPIPFTKEMEHVKTYVNLEKLRFDDKLEVIYNIEEVNFVIPALTVQMMVENAIKHGITRKKGKGKVRVTSHRQGNGLEEFAVIQIEDDGVGFDPKQKTDTSRSHVGLENTRERLKHLVNGSMEIESQIGLGTKVTIKIPI